jgi:long-chain acyl-CoA synthetase
MAFGMNENPVEIYSNLFNTLQASCARFGPAVHLVDVFREGRREYNFSEVGDLTARGAAWIRERLGAAAPAHVGILAENSACWIVAYYAVVSAGATAVPLDVRQEEAEILAVLAETETALLLVSPGFARFAAELAASGRIRSWQVLDGAWLEALRGCPPLAESPAGPDTPASIIYTSGTSGRSKGVVLTHGNLINQSWQNIPAIAVDESARLLAILPLNHIFVFVGLISCLEAGSQAVFLDSLKPARIVAALKDEGITHLAGIPLLYDAFLKGIALKVRARGRLVHLLFRALMRAGWRLYRLGGVEASRKLFGHLHAEFAPSARRFFCGGAKARPATIRGFLSLGYEFQEGFGLTETSGGCIINPPTRHKIIGSVGRPFGDTEVRILAPAADGEGEIAIRGRSVFREYYRNPQETAESRTSDGWFRTGDLGRLDATGNLTITGRAKEIIVLASGKKIAPDELEFHFTHSPLVGEVAAVGVGPSGAERIHLVVVPAAEAAKRKPAAELAAALHREMERVAQGLPSYKRPQGVTIRMDPLPRTTTRKVRRNELRAWLETAGPAAATAATAAAVRLTLAERELMQSEEMTAVVRACRQALGQAPDPARLGPQSNLYLDLGMDSIMLLEVVNQLETELQIKFQTDDVGWIQTLGDLLDAVRAAEAAPLQAIAGWRAALREVTAGFDGIPVRPAVRKLAAWLEPLDYGLIRFIGATFYRLRSHNVAALPSGGPFILAPNHVSNFDYPAVVGTLPARLRRRAYVIGKREVYSNLVGRILSAIHRVIPVDRAGDIFQALLSGARVLKNGQILYLHPEGTRSPTGRLQPLKNGVAILACELGVPVVPVYIKGTYDVFPKGIKFPRLFRLSRLKRYRVEVFYGDPIHPVGLCKEAAAGYQVLLERLRQTLESMESRLAGRSPSPADP